MDEATRVEALGPAERVIHSLINFSDHMVHNRPGMVVKRASGTVQWVPVIWKQDGDNKVVYRTVKQGRKSKHELAGVMDDSGKIDLGRGVTGEYRRPGLFREVAEHFYAEAAEIWNMDNEFAARWASWAFHKDHRDLKVVLCALMLVQNRSGKPVIEDGEILFYDDDFREVGEAMCLTRGDGLSPKLLLRVGDLLNLPEIAQINRNIGFGESQRNPARGRYYKVVEKWLRYREENPQMLEGLVKAGYRTTVMKLARRVGYKPTSPKFFEILRWRQKQSSDGRRTMAIGAEVSKAESWEGMTELQVCQHITDNKPSWKRIVGLLPTCEHGMTRSIVAAAVEAGCMSNQDLIIMTPTLEDMGLLKVESVEWRWKAACELAENRRAENIARNVKSKEAKEVLQDAAEKATEKALEAVTKDLRVYVIVDKSASMEGALERAKGYLKKFLGGFPMYRLHISVFNTHGSEVLLKSPKAAGVEQAFRGHRAGGGTCYAEGVRVLAHRKPKKGEDALMIFVGDEEDGSIDRLAQAVTASGINPVAFGLLKVVGTGWYGGGGGHVVRSAAARLGIPCFNIDEKMFETDDPYAMTRQLQHLIASTPVGLSILGDAPRRKTLIEEILETPLLKKPVWA